MPPSASVTVVSRPSGATCRLKGDRLLRGRTPLTLRNTLAGRYEIRAVDPAFERWQRTIEHDGASHDTVWISLNPKTKTRAVLRSVGLPGWGQFYSQRPTAGWIYMTGAVLAFGGSIAAQVAYVDRQEEIDDAETLEEWEEAVARVEEARDVRNTLQVTAAAFWIVSAIDAAVFFPRFESKGLTAGIELQPIPGAKGLKLAARIDF
ncbi:MAG TPA: PEGA domain-containing protein [Candidatus Eisenbacteria bacterium]|nr:PEGA domain-containing protein [Candidatus Eisenbacteria bacterium]